MNTRTWIAVHVTWVCECVFHALCVVGAARDSSHDQSAQVAGCWPENEVEWLQVLGSLCYIQRDFCQLNGSEEVGALQQTASLWLPHTDTYVEDNSSDQLQPPWGHHSTMQHHETVTSCSDLKTSVNSARCIYTPHSSLPVSGTGADCRLPSVQAQWSLDCC